MNDQPIRVAIVEDSTDEREGLSYLLRGSPGFTWVGAFANGEEAVRELPNLSPDIVLMDIHLPGISGIECVRTLSEALPGTRILMLTVYEDHDRIFDSLRAGATGYLLKKTPPAKLLEAIQELHQGGAPMSGPIARQVIAAFQKPAPRTSDPDHLSPREQEILGLLNQGFLYKEIADQLRIAVGTVRTHIARIYDKLHVRSRAEAMIKNLRQMPG
jgi:DNA-binding NarL/FixJ family response regulator